MGIRGIIARQRQDGTIEAIWVSKNMSPHLMGLVLCDTITTVVKVKQLISRYRKQSKLNGIN
jgi:hypothetical protein